MKYYLILTITAFIAFSCSAKNYNSPFINAEETTQFRFNMSQDEVMAVTGALPLFVQEGDNATTIWIYEIRTIKVLSDKDPVDGTFIPNKTHKDTRPDKPAHRLMLTFNAQGELTKWGPAPLDWEGGTSE